MRRILVFVFLLITLIFTTQSAITQQDAPTLVPPTPVPRSESGEAEIIPTESAVARIKANGVVKVGILFNAPPFGEFNIRGEVAGYDADLARSIAETWGVEVEFVQVTRDIEQSARMLRVGEIDILLGAQVHRRELSNLVEFSQAYYAGRQAVMVRADDPVETPADLASRSVGVVVATPTEQAVNLWQQRTGLSVNIQQYYTLDNAYVALAAGEVDAVVNSFYRLQRVALQSPDLTKILETPIAPEPFAVAVLRQDSSMRDLVNRTLQYLTTTGRLNEIHQAFFPGTVNTTVELWQNLGEDAPTPAGYPDELSFPSRFIVPDIQSNRVVRVAGLLGVTADSDASESERRIDTFHRDLLTEMASRWGATVEFIPDSTETALESVAAGEADIALGVEPDWMWADRVDFSMTYLLRGQRMMVRIDDDINSFVDLPANSTIVTPANEPDAAARVVEIAELPFVNVRVEIEQVREEDLAIVMLTDQDFDVDAVFADSLKLIPHIQANREDLRLTLTDEGNGRWYSPSYVDTDAFAPRRMTLAVPKNDVDFRLLVEYTLQELARDGTLQALLQPVMLPEDVPSFQIWPGSSNYLGFQLSS